MAGWKPINLMDVIGMASNPVNPGPKYAKRILNLYPHVKPGALTLRNGYAPKYTAPSNTTIDEPEYINFGVFFDRQANEAGQEIICEIQKGTLNPLDGSEIEDSINGMWFWVRPYWNGSQWVDAWQWVNKTIITKIIEIDAVYHSHFKIFALTDNDGADAFIGWIIYNKTKNQYSKIITCKLDGDEELSLNVALYENNWEVGDIVYVSRCWIDLEVHEELYENVERDDIVFHRINHDLRIGFGGKENRPGMAIGYRKQNMMIKEIDFTNKHSEVSEIDTIEKFAKIDGVFLDTHILNDQYGLDLELVSGDMAAGIYYYRLTGILDDYSEQLLAESSTYVNGSYDIDTYPYVKLGKDNPRFTRFRIYKSDKDDNLTFYKDKDVVVRKNEYADALGTIIESGRLIFYIENAELHTDSNAASVADEDNSVGNWVKEEGGGGSNSQLTSVANLFPYGTATPIAPHAGAYCLQLYKYTGFTSLKIFSPLITSSPQRVRISFYEVLRINEGIGITGLKLKVSSSERNIPNPFGDDAPADYIDLDLSEGDIWTQHEFELVVNGYLTFEMQEAYDHWVLGIDSLTVEIVESTGSEMTSYMGYLPTYNLVRGWDKVIKRRGRIYYLNPYVEKRYENYLLVSHIHSNTAFMWDIASFGNNRELEYGSSKTLSIELLPNNEIVILGDSSLTALADDGLVGILREPVYGVDVISPASVVNINGLILWCGKEEIYLLNIGNSLIPKGLLKDTIRDLYLSIEDKSKIFGVRNRFNTYRIRVDDTTLKIEYLLIDTGWIEERKWNFAEVYRPGFNNKLYFLSGGAIYEEEVDYTLPEEAQVYGDQPSE